RLVERALADAADRAADRTRLARRSAAARADPAAQEHRCGAAAALRRLAAIPFAHASTHYPPPAQSAPRILAARAPSPSKPELERPRAPSKPEIERPRPQRTVSGTQLKTNFGKDVAKDE